MIFSGTDNTPDYRRQVSHYSDLVIMALINSQDPVKRILALYDEAEDKQVFVAAMAATLLLRQRQWQAGAGGESK